MTPTRGTALHHLSMRRTQQCREPEQCAIDRGPHAGQGTRPVRNFDGNTPTSPQPPTFAASTFDGPGRRGEPRWCILRYLVGSASCNWASRAGSTFTQLQMHGRSHIRLCQVGTSKTSIADHCFRLLSAGLVTGTALPGRRRADQTRMDSTRKNVLSSASAVSTAHTVNPCSRPP